MGLTSYAVLYDDPHLSYSVIYKEPDDSVWWVYEDGLQPETAKLLVEALEARNKV